MGGRRRIATYDLVRLVAISLVVLIHVLSPFWGAGALVLGDLDLVRIFSRSIRFVVPLFVMVTGALSWTRGESASSGGAGGSGWGAFLLRRLRGVLVPYVVWSMIFMQLARPIWPLSIGAFDGVVSDLLLGTAWYHLYFVPVILGVYLLAPAASLIYRRAGAVVVMLISLGLGIVVPAEAARLGMQGRLFVDVVVLVTSYLPFAGLGAWYESMRGSVRWRSIERYAWLPLLLGGLALRVWFGALRPWPADPYVSAGVGVLLNVVQCFGLLGLLRVVADGVPKVTGLATGLAPLVYGVYLTHPLLVKAAVPLVIDGPMPPAVWVIFMWPAIAAVSFIAVRWASRYSALWWLHGVSPASARSAN